MISLGERIGACLKPGDVIALRGTLAAGKTTLTKGIARSLGIDEEITSPTFTLISEYQGRIALYHMDAYRLDSTEGFLDIGAEEFLYGNGVSVVEWSERVTEAMPKEAITISIVTMGDGSREVTMDNWPYGGLC